MFGEKIINSEVEFQKGREYFHTDGTCKVVTIMDNELNSGKL